MPEDIMARLNRLASAGRKPEPKPDVKQFTMPNREPEPPARGKATWIDCLMKWILN